MPAAKFVAIHPIVYYNSHFQKEEEKERKSQRHHPLVTMNGCIVHIVQLETRH